MNIVFMGTPDFAVPSLKALANDDRFSVRAVYTQPDKPVGRKRVMTPPDVKVCAQECGIPVYQPETLRTQEAADEINAFEPDVIVVIAYGKILPQSILNIPKYCCVNIHGSLLPSYRGAAPIQRAVIDGVKATGITAMRMDAGLDTGDIIDTVETAIEPNETAGELFDRLSELAPKLLTDTLISLENGTATFTTQGDEGMTYAKPLNKDEAVIDWSCSAESIHNKVRGMNPWPIAYTYYNGKKLKLYCVKPCDRSGNAGELISLDPPVVACGEGAVELLSVQLEGKKQMSATDFLRGQRLQKGDKFVS